MTQPVELWHASCQPDYNREMPTDTRTRSPARSIELGVCASIIVVGLAGLFGLLHQMQSVRGETTSPVAGAALVAAAVVLTFAVASAALACVLLGIWFAFSTVATPVSRWLERRTPAAGHCVGCGYNLRGNVSGICPKCGNEISA